MPPSPAVAVSGPYYTNVPPRVLTIIKEDVPKEDRFSLREAIDALQLNPYPDGHVTEQGPDGALVYMFPVEGDQQYWLWYRVDDAQKKVDVTFVRVRKHPSLERHHRSVGDGAFTWDRAIVRRLLDKRLSEDELYTLLFDLGIDHQNLPGDTKSAKIRELILLVERQDRQEDLVRAVRANYPHIVL